MGDDLPLKTEVGAATEAIGGRDGESIEDIVLVEVDAVGPVLSVEELKSQFDAQSCRVYGVWCREVIRKVLGDTYSVWG